MWLTKCLNMGLNLNVKNTLMKRRKHRDREQTPSEGVIQAPALTPIETPNKSEKKCRLLKMIIVLYSIFFVAEISTGIYTHSLALVADSFHMLNDLSGFIVSLTAIRLAQRKESPPGLTYGWKRAEILGSFINGAFLLGLSLVTFLLSIERFLSVPHLKNPIIVLAVGCAGLTLNVISILFLHDLHHHHHHHHDEHGSDHCCSSGECSGHNQDQGNSNEEKKKEKKDHHHHHHHHDLGIKAVLMHLIGDVFNNIGIIILSVIVWKLKSPARFYADPAVSTAIAFIILNTARPVCQQAGYILMEGAPSYVKIHLIKKCFELFKNESKILDHDNLHVWSLSDDETIASVCVVTQHISLEESEELKGLIRGMFRFFGVKSATIEQKLESCCCGHAHGSSIQPHQSTSSIHHCSSIPKDFISFAKSCVGKNKGKDMEELASLLGLNYSPQQNTQLQEGTPQRLSQSDEPLSQQSSPTQTPTPPIRPRQIYISTSSQGQSTPNRNEFARRSSQSDEARPQRLSQLHDHSSQWPSPPQSPDLVEPPTLASHPLKSHKPHPDDYAQKSSQSEKTKPRRPSHSHGPSILQPFDLEAMPNVILQPLKLQKPHIHSITCRHPPSSSNECPEQSSQPEKSKPQRLSQSQQNDYAQQSSQTEKAKPRRSSLSQEATLQCSPKSPEPRSRRSSQSHVNQPRRFSLSQESSPQQFGRAHEQRNLTWEPTPPQMDNTSPEPVQRENLSQQESSSSLGTIRVEATLKLKSFKTKKDKRE